MWQIFRQPIRAHVNRVESIARAYSCTISCTTLCRSSGFVGTEQVHETIWFGEWRNIVKSG